ncbi:F-box/LRR-repeat protein 6 [Denticeps clupeoides]|uniref:F-box domain-containing protein n=1 Tax=Denticeps clupeoides TaxID=299321 RepID=A0AAY4E7A1_9TELE|nr:F-box/LRR-repeat protein 6 [Denticeps clupeoides]
MERTGESVSDVDPGNTSGSRPRADAAGKAPVRRTSSSSPAPGTKAKKKKPRVPRKPRPNFTVEQGEDMLLIVSNVNSHDRVWKPKKKRRKKTANKGQTTATASKKRKASREVILAKQTVADDAPPRPGVACSGDGTDRWGRRMPVEVLVEVFRLVVGQDGAVPFLCRAGRVCRLWRDAASNPVLWRAVTVGHCWTEPGKVQLQSTEAKIRNTVHWLAENRFSQLRVFSLCHWKKHVDYVVQVVSESCPHLNSLKLSHCSGVTEKAFQSIGSHCKSFESIDVQHTEVQGDALVTFLEMYGSQIKKVLFTYGPRSEKLLTVISRGSCPELRLLAINTNLTFGFFQLPVCIPALQAGCPKLQVFSMMNLSPRPKMTRNTVSAPGFPMLEELCVATSSDSFLTDQDLSSFLHGSPRLRVLDIRGCSRITTAGLICLPCEELECLFWGQYFNSSKMLSSKKGIHLLTQKWSQTLRELDLANHNFSEEDIEVAMGHLTHTTRADSVQSLNLSGTKITSHSLRLLISHSQALSYLNLSSCRNLPRGLKRLYRGQENIQQLLDNLT